MTTNDIPRRASIDCSPATNLATRPRTRLSTCWPTPATRAIVSASAMATSIASPTANHRTELGKERRL